MVGFIAAAGVAGWLAERGYDRGFGTLLAMSIAHAIIFIGGVGWLAVHFGMQRALELGLYPFVAATAAKTLLGAATVPIAWKIVAEVRNEL